MCDFLNFVVREERESFEDVLMVIVVNHCRVFGLRGWRG